MGFCQTNLALAGAQVTVSLSMQMQQPFRQDKHRPQPATHRSSHKAGRLLQHIATGGLLMNPTGTFEKGNSND